MNYSNSFSFLQMKKRSSIQEDKVQMYYGIFWYLFRGFNFKTVFWTEQMYWSSLSLKDFPSPSIGVAITKWKIQVLVIINGKTQCHGSYPFFFFSLVDSPQIFTLLLKIKAIFQGKKGHFGPRNIYWWQS